jgi:hypothetical protein
VTGALTTAPNVARADDVYQQLVDAYAQLPQQEVADFHARLILLLINQIGDHATITEAISAAMPSHCASHLQT